MQMAATEKFLTRILAYGAAFTTIFIINGSVTDPVNAPKLLVIGAVGCAAISVVLGTGLIRNLKNELSILTISLLFLLAMLVSTIASKAPLSQNIYGVYGRNNGLLAYIFLIFILLASTLIRGNQNFRIIVQSLLIAGYVNVIYCLWVILFGDFLSWNNPYGNILGTLGNPNFIGAFLGVIFSTGYALLIDKNTKLWFRWFLVIFLPICAFEIVKSHAIQGRVVALFGSILVTFLYIRSKYNKIVLILYSIASFILGGFALAGALQHGPLTQLIYKTSVSLRGQYWLAGWNTGISHPWTGVGMDTFGDWYRRMRDIRAIELPGTDIVVNTAHNVPMDMFAFGGWPLLASYLSVMGYAGICLFKVAKRNKNFDVTFAILGSAWAGYQLQSIISINQIGLAVWGWFLSGALIAYERNSRLESSDGSAVKVTVRKVKNDGKGLPAQVPTFAFSGLLLGILVALPPLSADIQWRSAQKVRTLQALEQSFKPSYFNPQNSMKYVTNIQTLAGSNLRDLTKKYTLEAIKWNRDSYDFWKILYLIETSNTEEKARALANMKRLDPLNPQLEK